MIFVIATFVGVLTIVLGSYWAFVLRPEAQDQQLLEKRMRPEAVARKTKLTSGVEATLSGVFGALQAMLERSGVALKVPAFLFVSWMSGVVIGLLGWSVSHRFAVVLVLAICAASGPYLWVRWMAKKRLWKFQEQFPEAMELIARSLRAGHAFTTALSMVGEELPSPVGPEFKLLHDRQNFGLPLPEALKELAHRVPSIDTRFFVTAVLTQREAGGNLSAVLDNLAAVIRDRFNVKRQVRVVSAHGRMTAVFLTAMPPAVLLLELWIAPSNVKLLVSDPLGLKILAVGAILQVTGMLVIRRIANVEYEMVLPLFLAFVGTFVAVGVSAGSATHLLLLRMAPGARRLRSMADASVVIDASPEDSLTDRLTRFEEHAVRLIPKSPKELKRLRRRLARGGYRRANAAVVFSFAEILLPLLFAGAALALLKFPQALVFAVGGAVIGHLLPGAYLNRLIASRKAVIANALPDALDLLTVCLEAGYGLDLAISRTGDELMLAHPALGEEFKLLTSETRAGKPRLEAFRGIEARTKNDEVRGLVAMLAQTDRFGTSVAQALRTLSATSRTKRRQRAEERAAKVGSKLVFPLVLCLFPALYAVILGPAIVQIARVFINGFLTVGGR